jgi:hypothetical protein
LRSVINYAPYSEDSLKDVIADRFAIGAVKGVLRRALRRPRLWSITCQILSWVDHRPGRLYSFVCIRP